MKGKFIVIEGLDGAGKTLMISMLKEVLPENKFLFTREPGGTHFAEKIRSIMSSDESREVGGESMFCLVWSARVDHFKNKILPALDKGINVITDRFDLSTFAYQIYGEDLPRLEGLFFEVREVFLKEHLPDAYIFLDVPVEECLKRMSESKRKLDQFDKRGIDFHEKVLKGYQAWQEKTSSNFKVNANQRPERVKEEILRIISDITK